MLVSIHCSPDFGRTHRHGALDRKWFDRFPITQPSEAGQMCALTAGFVHQRRAGKHGLPVQSDALGARRCKIEVVWMIDKADIAERLQHRDVTLPCPFVCVHAEDGSGLRAIHLKHLLP